MVKNSPLPPFNTMLDDEECVRTMESSTKNRHVPKCVPITVHANIQYCLGHNVMKLMSQKQNSVLKLWSG